MLEEGSELGQPEGMEAAPGLDVREGIASSDSPAWVRLQGQIAPAWMVGGAGALIVVLEGLQQLQQYQQNWTAYRSTSERLKHEMFLFVSRAGPYARAPRAEESAAQRVAFWLAATRRLRLSPLRDA